ncbi:hypothetical protein [Pedobacter frigidisoli]|uniref:hypothetical protein n=1 Tax=Pedobacter frigidisoli TaxID=2530455 RepID=UPI00292E0B88|nr:hypothetical protein [Pedobacter frigidisoli]
MSLRSFWIFVVMILTASAVEAAEGCRVGSTIYPTFAGYNTIDIDLFTLRVTLGNKTFYTSNPISTSPNTCPGWAQVTATNGVCLYGNPTIGAVIEGFQLAVCLNCPAGTLVQYDYLYCDLDDYSWLFGASAAMVGLVMIRRKN